VIHLLNCIKSSQSPQQQQQLKALIESNVMLFCIDLEIKQQQQQKTLLLSGATFHQQKIHFSMSPTHHHQLAHFPHCSLFSAHAVHTVMKRKMYSLELMND
jgi:hypothetical protein